jgi:hypothetical protein
MFFSCFCFPACPTCPHKASSGNTCRKEGTTSSHARLQPEGGVAPPARRQARLSRSRQMGSPPQKRYASVERAVKNG